MRTLLLLFALAATASCYEMPTFYYAPENATVSRGGMPAQVTHVPAEAPQGTVEIASFGIQRVHPRGAAEFLALHVRMIVDNEGNDQPWTVDTRQQLVEVPQGRSRAMFINTPSQSGPLLTIARRQRQTIDLYFPLPSGLTAADQLPAFDVLWQADTTARPVSGRTHFNRMETYEVGPYYDSLASGWWPYWWYDPLYPTMIYVREPIVAAPVPYH